MEVLPFCMYQEECVGKVYERYVFAISFGLVPSTFQLRELKVCQDYFYG